MIKCSTVSEETRSASVWQHEVLRYNADSALADQDEISVEEPLEILIAQPDSDSIPVAVTMRTPGNDPELAIGFLFTEGIIHDASAVDRILCNDKCNVVTVHLKRDVQVDSSVLDRHSFVASSCGVCGKRSIAAVRVKRNFQCHQDVPRATPQLIQGLPSALLRHQSEFNRTGGTHASCLFDAEGNLLDLREDIGRHNALDKVLGNMFLSHQMPLTNHILRVSGRASFELVQKAAHAGLPVLVAVGAPSSLAVQLAAECDMTLIGFVRNDRFNIYTGAHRIYDN